MKFLTEDDLRLKYHEIPFESFVVGKNERLTPGAKMFLMDRKITLIDENNPLVKTNAMNTFVKKDSKKEAESDGNFMLDWFSLRCEFIKTASDLSKVDVILAQEICSLEQCLLAISKSEEFVLPTFLQLSQLAKEEKELDREFLEERLSSVSMFFQSSTGAILIALYSIYSRINCFEKQASENEMGKLHEIGNSIGKLIMHYLGGGS